MASSWSDSARGTALAKVRAKVSGVCDQRALPQPGVGQHRPGGAQLGRREHQVAAELGRGEGHAGPAEVHAVQPLGDQPAEEWPITTGGDDSREMTSE